MKNTKIEEESLSGEILQRGEPRQTKSVSQGTWSNLENLLYLSFIDFHKVTMNSKNKMRKLQIFDQMSYFISFRNSIQCRSHHQKMLQKYKNIKKIIETYRELFGKEYCRRFYRNQKPSLTKSITHSETIMENNITEERCSQKQITPEQKKQQEQNKVIQSPVAQISNQGQMMWVYPIIGFNFFFNPFQMM